MSELIRFRPLQKAIVKTIWEDEAVGYHLLNAYRRFGKSYIMVTIGLMFCAAAVGLIPPGSAKIAGLMRRNAEVARIPTVRIFLPFDSQATKTVWKALRTEADKWGHWTPPARQDLTPFAGAIRVLEADKTVEMVNGDHRAVIVFGALARNPDAERGDGAEIVMSDEDADIEHEVTQAVVLPMLKDTDGLYLAFGTTKATLNVRRKRAQIAAMDKGKVTIVSYDDALAAGDITQEQYNQTVQEYGGKKNPIFMQEYLCRDDVPVEGAILEAWAKRQVDEADIAHLPVILAVDIGTLPYTVLAFAIDEDTPDAPLVLTGFHQFWPPDAQSEQIAEQMADIGVRAGGGLSAA